MGVAAHLKIELSEYDARIRTFVPHYDHMLSCAANSLRLLGLRAPAIVDLGIGTGALAERALAVCPDAGLTGIDADSAMLEAAAARLAGNANVTVILADFLEHSLPGCDALIACIALHHVRTPGAKQAFYRSCFEALRPAGMLITADCFPALDERLAATQREAWVAHLEQSYPRAEAEGYLEAWAGEDTYFPLDHELQWLREAGFRTEIIWRADGFAVLRATRPEAEA